MAEEQAFITPAIVRWGRERIDLSVQVLAKKLSVKKDLVVAWEEGTRTPTLRQAERLANALYIPFGYLFLKTPPEEKPVPLPDFRTVKDSRFKHSSAEFRDLLDDVLAKHDWYREFVQQEGKPSVSFVASFQYRRDSPQAVANSIADTLRISSALREVCKSWEEFLRFIIQRAEEAGILVMRSGVVGGNVNRHVSTQEFRGFAISDRVAPLIYINGRDWKAAQIFTVAHELGHIWIGETGISNEDLASKEEPEGIERFCNDIAAEVLVPSVDFVARWIKSDAPDVNVTRLCRFYRVSSLVVWRRAYVKGLIGWNLYKEVYKHQEEELFRKQKDRQEGGNFFATLFSRNSYTFTSTLVAAAMSGRALYREAANLLNVKVATIPKIAEKLA